MRKNQWKQNARKSCGWRLRFDDIPNAIGQMQLESVTVAGCASCGSHKCVALYCSVLHYVAACCTVLQSRKSDGSRGRVLRQCMYVGAV